MASPPIIDDPSQASRRAKMRVAVAAVLLLTAVGILAVLNQRKPEIEESVEPATPVQESISSTEAEPSAAEPEATPPVAPSAETAALPGAIPNTPTTPPPPPIPGKLPPLPTAKEATALSHAVKEETTQVAEPAAPVAPAKTETVPPAQPQAAPKTAVAVPKAFIVQLGVFTDMDNAKQLQAKLAEHGIPSHTETRVQVGPFRNRADAEQAREKLKALGITAVIVPK